MQEESLIYLRALRNESIQGYEDIVSSGGKALRIVTPHARLERKIKK